MGSQKGTAFVASRKGFCYLTIKVARRNYDMRRRAIRDDSEQLPRRDQRAHLNEYVLQRISVRGRKARYQAPPAQIPSTQNYCTGLLPRVIPPNRSSGYG